MLIERVKKIEKITEDITPIIQLYYISYKEVLKESDGIKIDTTDCNLFDKITDLLNNFNGGIKNGFKD